MEVDTVNIFGADARKERHWGGGMEQSEGSASKLQEDSPWTLQVGVGHRPRPDPFSHSGLQPIAVPGSQVKMKSMFNEKNRAEGEESGWTAWRLHTG